MAHRHDGGCASINNASTMLAGYAQWLAEQPLFSRTARCNSGP
jgi:hypothetical protein